MKAIGIDIGTTSICGIVIDAVTGELLASRTKNNDAFLTGCADWEKIQSAEKIISVAAGLLDELIDSDTAVIGVTGQMHGIVYTDDGGKAVSPLYTWQDQRGNLPYRDTTYARHLNSYTGYGCVTDSYNRINGIRPDTAVGFCTIQDYLVMQLCGLKRPVIHATDAASFGCYDPEKGVFDYDIGEAEVTADYRIAGKYRGIPVSAAIGDNQASVFSTLAGNDGILLNVGTGSQVSIISDSVFSGADNIETRPYFEGRYLIAGSALCGGRAYSLLKNFYREILGYVCDIDDGKVYEIMGRMLLHTSSASLTADTRFAGTRGCADIRGSITGIGTENFTPSQLTFAILDGIAAELYEMYEKFGVSRNQIVGSGNGLRKNGALVRRFEEKFDKRMVFPLHVEEAAFGAALFGLVVCGMYENAAAVQRLIKYN